MTEIKKFWLNSNTPWKSNSEFYPWNSTVPLQGKVGSLPIIIFQGGVSLKLQVSRGMEEEISPHREVLPACFKGSNTVDGSEILHHRQNIKPCKWWETLPTSTGLSDFWTIHSSSHFPDFQKFLFYLHSNSILNNTCHANNTTKNTYLISNKKHSTQSSLAIIGYFWTQGKTSPPHTYEFSWRWTTCIPHNTSSPKTSQLYPSMLWNLNPPPNRNIHSKGAHSTSVAIARKVNLPS